MRRCVPVCLRSGHIQAHKLLQLSNLHSVVHAAMLACASQCSVIARDAISMARVATPAASTVASAKARAAASPLGTRSPAHLPFVVKLKRRHFRCTPDAAMPANTPETTAVVCSASCAAVGHRMQEGVLNISPAAGALLPTVLRTHPGATQARVKARLARASQVVPRGRRRRRRPLRGVPMPVWTRRVSRARRRRWSRGDRVGALLLLDLLHGQVPSAAGAPAHRSVVFGGCAHVVRGPATVAVLGGVYWRS